MPNWRREHLFAPVLVLATFLGVWVGHNLEYLRVAGAPGLSLGLLRPTHVYMLPAGALLLVLTAVAGARLLRTLVDLGRRLDAAGAALAAALRGRLPSGDARRAALDGVPTPPSLASAVAGLWILLTALQIGIYVLQENLEAAVAGAPTPGAAAISGVHWAAPLVHSAVAFLLALAIVAFFRRVSISIDRIVRRERLARQLWRRLIDAVPPLRPQRLAGPRLHELGASLWCRPPPSVRAA